MANQYDTNLKLQAIADAIGDSSSSGLIQALEDIADAVAGGGGGGSSTAGLVSDNFSEIDTYDLGDYCIHNNTLYVCINAITTPGAWDLSDWQATNAGIQLSSLNSALTKNTLGAQINLSDYVSSTSPYTFPSDGYVALKIAPNSTLSAVTAYICSASSLSAYIDVSLPKETNGWNNQMINVKKGMKFYLLSALDSRSFAIFIPLE